MATSKPIGASYFSGRLTELMRARGLISTGTASGVDVRALSKSAGVSYEMARRYCEGKAIPRAQTLRAIADWLRVSPADLLYGEPARDSNRIIHTEVLQACLEATRRAEDLNGKPMPAEKMARLVALLYEEAIDGREISEGLLARLLRFL